MTDESVDEAAGKPAAFLFLFLLGFCFEIQELAGMLFTGV